MWILGVTNDGLVVGVDESLVLSLSELVPRGLVKVAALLCAKLTITADYNRLKLAAHPPTNSHGLRLAKYANTRGIATIAF